MLTAVCFFIRYIPFWSIPIAFISAEFGYKYWLKRRKKIYRVCFGLSIFSLICSAYYFWAGGPEKSVKFLLSNFRSSDGSFF